tara:strand:+ start:21 stop:581 length:561 start_codon:yes stop_codon:yes gene_type:complete
MFGICILDNQRTEKGWGCPVNVGSLVYILKCEDLDFTGSNYYIEIIGKKRFSIDKLISPTLEKPDEYFPPNGPSMKQMLKQSSGKPLYFQASVNYLDDIRDSIDAKDWNFLLGKLELRIIDIANKMGIEFENFSDFVTSSGLNLENAEIQDLYTIASMCSLPIEVQQNILESNYSKEIVEILAKEI